MKTILKNLKSNNKYKFSREEDFDEIYKIAKFQFKKIINNFNEFEFRDDFTGLFHGRYKYFLKKNNVILCGALGNVFEDYAISDIFFWNILYEKSNILEYRLFYEEVLSSLSEEGVKNLIIPMHKFRHKYGSFKKQCEKIFFTKTEHKFSDKKLINTYKNHYLLKVDLKEYFEKSKELKRIKP